MKSPKDSHAPLREMVLLLDTRELTEVKNLLRRSPRSGKQAPGKALALLEAIIANPNADAAALGSLIYGQPDDSAFKYLRLRLWNRLVESLDPTPMEHTTVEHDLEHLARAAKVLWHRGGYISLELLLSSLSRRAESMECYPVLQDVLHLWGRLKRLRREDSSAIDQQLAQARHRLQEIQAAEAICDHLRLDFPNTLPTAAHAIASDKASLDSPRLRFHHIQFRMLLLHQLQHSDEAYKLIRPLQLLVEAHPSLQEPDYRAMAANMAAHTAMHMGLHKQALDHLLSTNLPATSCPHLRWQADLLTAEAMRLSGRGQAAFEAYQLLIHSTAADPCAFRRAARHVLAATAALQADRPELALDCLLPHSRDLSCQSDWTMAYRLVQIMALAELERLDEAELKIDALRKSVAACPTGDWMQQRYHAAVKVMQRWLRTNFTPDILQDAHFHTLSATAQHSGYGRAERWPLQEWLALKCGKNPSMQRKLTGIPDGETRERIGRK